MKPREMWHQYCWEKQMDENTPHEEWTFCGGGKVGDELAELVLQGRKTATASYYDLYEKENETIPTADALSVVLYDSGEAACIIRNTSVVIVPFNAVPHWHAWLEGEEDRSLDSWRRIHEVLFTQECQEAGISFSVEGKVVLEYFEVVYPERDLQRERYMLVVPDEKFLDQVAAYRRSFLQAGDSMDGTGRLRQQEDPREWLEETRFYASPASVINNGWAHATQLLCVDRNSGELVGMIQVREELNDYLRGCAGHIGYSVAPGERKKGIATWMLKNVLPYCKALQISQVLVSCVENNEASRRTILANDGRYLNTVTWDGETEQVERYVIELDEEM